MLNTTCCFIGHRRIDESEELKIKLRKEIERVIVEEGVGTFLFGSASRFDSLCHELVNEIKGKYPHIRRVYVRAEFPYINEQYEAYLLESYDETYYPEKIMGAGRASYVERNREMIEKSEICIFYYNKANAPTNRKSGTGIAFDYAKKKDKRIIVFPK